MEKRTELGFSEDGGGAEEKREGSRSKLSFHHMCHS
jgi:hypothetical protein